MKVLVCRSTEAGLYFIYSIDNLQMKFSVLITVVYLNHQHPTNMPVTLLSLSQNDSCMTLLEKVEGGWRRQRFSLVKYSTVNFDYMSSPKAFYLIRCFHKVNIIMLYESLLRSVFYTGYLFLSPINGLSPKLAVSFTIKISRALYFVCINGLHSRYQSQTNWGERNGGDPGDYMATSPRKEFGNRGGTDTNSNWRRHRGGGEDDEGWRASRNEKWG